MTEAPVAPPSPVRDVPIRERGYMHDPVAWGGGMSWDDLTQEATPELAWPLSVTVFHRMEATDPSVASSLKAVTSPLVRTPARLNGKGCDDQVVEHVARNLGIPIKGAAEDTEADAVPLRGADRFSFRAHLPNALLSLKYGHAYLEQLYWLDDAGLAHLRKLALRPSRTIRRVNVARDGGLDSIEQYGASGLYGTRPWSVDGVRIPVKRLVAYVNEREGDNWLGRSLLRSSYKNWVLKDKDLRTMSVSNHRNGVGHAVYTGAENEQDLSKGRALARAMRGGDDAGAAIAYGAKLRAYGVDGETPDILASIRYHDEQIARGVLAHFLNLGSQAGGQVGSYNLGSVLANTFNTAIGAIGDGIADTFNRHVITDLVEANWGKDEPVPQLEFDDLNSTQTELDRFRMLTGLTDDQALIAWMRRNIAGLAGLTIQEDPQ